MSAEPKLKSGSESFTSTAINRDSLVPLATIADGDILHQGVCISKEANKFSASRGHPVYPIKLPARTLSLSIGDLSPGQFTSKHRHAYESLIYIIQGSGYSVIEEKRVPWKAGDAIYVPPWNWHQHFADQDSQARYITATNLPLLYCLGQTVLREEHTDPSNHESPLGETSAKTDAPAKI